MGFALLMFGAPGLAIGVATFGAWQTAGIGQYPWEHMQWSVGDAPMLLDVDGDGAVEVVGVVRFLVDGEDDGLDVVPSVAAFDVEEEERLWHFDVEDAPDSDLLLAAAGGRLWVADGRGRLRSLDPATGEPRSEATLGEKPERFCGGPDGALRIRLADRTERAIDLGTGAVTPLPAVDGGAACAGGFWSSDGQSPDGAVAEDVPSIDTVLARGLSADGLDGERRLVAPDGRTWLLAERSAGTRVPFVVATYPDGTQAWKAQVPAGDPLLAEEGAPEAAGVGEGRLFVPWSLKEGEEPNRLACFDARTGARRWDATLPDDTGDAEHIVTDGRRVYVARWTWLHILDAGTGELLGTIGRW